MIQEKLNEILNNHKKWLNHEDGGKRADLRYADLSFANLISADLSYANLRSANLHSASLRSADLRYADLSYANLSSANLRSADLRSADLSYADLRSANLHSASLRSADLRYADLSYANLSSADLSSADLSYANLSSADLSYANLRSADLSSADLSSADLSSADLSYANLSNIINMPYIPMSCPDINSFTGFKKLKKNEIYYIIELFIPIKAKRSSAFGRKCRCEYAKVKNIERLKNGECVATDIKTIVNYNYGHQTVYTIGETVYPDSYDENRFNECSHGIHFFINKQEAINY